MAKKKGFSLGQTQEKKTENSTKDLNVLSSQENDIDALRIKLNSALIECVKQQKEKSPDKWKYYVQKIAKEHSFKMNYVQFKPFEEGQGRHINFYIGMMLAILETSEDASIVFSKDDVQVVSGKKKEK